MRPARRCGRVSESSSSLAPPAQLVREIIRRTERVLDFNGTFGSKAMERAVEM